MNSAQIHRLEVIRSSVEDLHSEIEYILDAERVKYDHMSGGLRQTFRGEEICNAINELETIDHAFDTIDESLWNIIYF